MVVRPEQVASRRIDAVISGASSSGVSEKRNGAAPRDEISFDNGKSFCALRHEWCRSSSRLAPRQRAVVKGEPYVNRRLSISSTRRLSSYGNGRRPLAQPTKMV